MKIFQRSRQRYEFSVALFGRGRENVSLSWSELIYESWWKRWGGFAAIWSLDIEYSNDL